MAGRLKGEINCLLHKHSSKTDKCSQTFKCKGKMFTNIQTGWTNVHKLSNAMDKWAQTFKCDRQMFTNIQIWWAICLRTFKLNGQWFAILEGGRIWTAGAHIKMLAAPILRKACYPPTKRCISKMYELSVIFTLFWKHFWAVISRIIPHSMFRLVFFGLSNHILRCLSLGHTFISCILHLVGCLHKSKNLITKLLD